MTHPSESSAYDFHLPPELVAQDPPTQRGDARLLLVEPDGGVRGEMVFRDLPGYLRAGDLLVLNESRVLPARLQTRRPDSGGVVEILLVRPETEGNRWLALARPQRRLRPGSRLEVLSQGSGPAGDPGPMLEVVAKLADGQVVVTCDQEMVALAEAYGVMPLPPYIRRPVHAAGGERDRRDRERYQTVFATADASGAGSVAAPTAGLHFSDATLSALAKAEVNVARVSLHVGPGTFRPPSSEQIASGRLHREFFCLPEATAAAVAATRERGGRVIAVGTTSLRVLETAARLELDTPGPSLRTFIPTEADPRPEFTGVAEHRPGGWEVRGETRLFLKPPTRVTSVDGLLTNFHLPGSSLLMLVATIAGEKTWPLAYDHAVRNGLHFYSYGDCMLILPGCSGPEESR